MTKMEEENKTTMKKKKADMWWDKVGLMLLLIITPVLFLATIGPSYAIEKLGVLFPWGDERFWWKFWCFLVPLLVLSNSVYDLFEACQSSMKSKALLRVQVEEMRKARGPQPREVEAVDEEKEVKEGQTMEESDKGSEGHNMNEIIREQLLVLTKELAMERSRRMNVFELPEVKKIESQLKESERKLWEAEEKLRKEGKMYEEKLSQEIEKKDHVCEGEDQSSSWDEHDEYYERVIKNMDQKLEESQRKLKKVEERQRKEKEKYEEKMTNLNKEISDLVGDLYEEMEETEYYQKKFEEKMEEIEMKVKESYQEEMDDLAHKLYVESSNCEYYVGLVRCYKESNDWLAKQNSELNSHLFAASLSDRHLQDLVQSLELKASSLEKEVENLNDELYISSTTSKLYENYL